MISVPISANSMSAVSEGTMSSKNRACSKMFQVNILMYQKAISFPWYWKGRETRYIMDSKYSTS